MDRRVCCRLNSNRHLSNRQHCRSNRCHFDPEIKLNTTKKKIFNFISKICFKFYSHFIKIFFFMRNGFLPSWMHASNYKFKNYFHIKINLLNKQQKKRITQENRQCPSYELVSQWIRYSLGFLRISISCQTNRESAFFFNF